MKNSITKFPKLAPITFLRHCESIFNAENSDFKNCLLSKKGVDQAKKLSGSYEYVIISPLKRCQETLKYSQIIYDKIEEMEIVREHKVNICDFLEHEEVVFESETEIMERIIKFKEILKEVQKIYKSILVVTHSDFVWYFTMRKVKDDCFGKWLENGEMYTIDEF